MYNTRFKNYRSGVLVPEKKDERNYKYKITAETYKTQSATSNSLRYRVTEVYDQAALGSCVCHAVIQYLRILNSSFKGSRLFNYFHARELHKEINADPPIDPDSGISNQVWNYKDNSFPGFSDLGNAVFFSAADPNIINDSGVYMINGLKSLQKWSVPPEIYWKYDSYTDYDENGYSFTYTGVIWQHVPTLEAYKKVYDLGEMSYYELEQSIYAIKHAIDNYTPVMIGFYLFQSWFYLDSSGLVSEPYRNAQGQWTSDGIAYDNNGNIVPDSIQGEFHAVVIIGYNDDIQCVEVVNSYGPSWGDSGIAYIPYSYILEPELVIELWTFSIKNQNIKPKKKTGNEYNRIRNLYEVF